LLAAAATPSAPSGIAPLLRQLMTEYAATGLSPAYLSRPESIDSNPNAEETP